jgi:hypothetical protein
MQSLVGEQRMDNMGDSVLTVGRRAGTRDAEQFIHRLEAGRRILG